MSRVNPQTSHRVRRRARGRCEYCHSQEQVVGEEFTIDHVIPRARGGSDAPRNLALCCFACNTFKGARIEARDPLTGKRVPFYSPRQQPWTDHFRWSDDGLRIIGKTAVGRAAVVALRLNRTQLLVARQTWVRWGVHPPVGDD